MKYEYGNWIMVALNFFIFVTFLKSVFKPRTKIDWQTFRIFSAFLAALFAEMYGFPLTIYLLTSFFGNRFFNIDFSHDSGHLLNKFFNIGGDPHFDLFHLVSYGLIAGGFILIASAWKVLYNARKQKKLAETGAYHYIRHPQYAGFILIILGFLLQWPTIITLLMAPVLIFRYVKLAHEEEREVGKKFLEAFENYKKETHGFIPSLKLILQQSKISLLGKKNYQ